MTAKFVKLFGIAALVVSAAACGEFTRQGRAPVVVVVDRLSTQDGQGTLLSDVVTKNSTFNDMAKVEMSLVSKDPGTGSGPSDLNAVTITRYRVEYRRTDGRNLQGTDVPYAFDSALTFTVSGSQGSSFQIVRHTAKSEAPLKALGVNNDIISTIAYVTFYGHDQAGNDVSATATMGIDFGNFADAD